MASVTYSRLLKAVSAYRWPPENAPFINVAAEVNLSSQLLCFIEAVARLVNQRNIWKSIRGVNSSSLDVAKRPCLHNQLSFQGALAKLTPVRTDLNLVCTRG